MHIALKKNYFFPFDRFYIENKQKKVARTLQFTLKHFSNPSAEQKKCAKSHKFSWIEQLMQLTKHADLSLCAQQSISMRITFSLAYFILSYLMYQCTAVFIASHRIWTLIERKFKTFVMVFTYFLYWPKLCIMWNIARICFLLFFKLLLFRFLLFSLR